MAKLVDTTEWREFRVGDLFDIAKGSRLTKKDQVSGDIRFIGSSATNNGVTEYVGNDVHIFDEDALTVAYNGSVGESFYQDEPFWASDDVNVLRRKDAHSFGAGCALFVATLTRYLGERFGFTYKWNLKAMSDTIVKLPATPDVKPDWDYMERYMAHVMDEMRPVAEELHQLESTLSLHAVDVSGWKEFRVGELFEVRHPSRARSLKQYSDGDVAFVATGVGEYGNGVSSYVQPLGDEQLDKGGCITVSPVDGKCFWQPNDFCGRGGAGSSILLCYPKDIQFDEYVGMFIAAVMTDIYSGWTYSDAGSGSVVKQSSIKLPATLDGKPDWDAMAEMMRGYTDSVRDVAHVIAELGR